MLEVEMRALLLVVVGLQLMTACAGEPAKATAAAAPAVSAAPRVSADVIRAALNSEAHDNTLMTEQGIMVLLSTPFSRIADAAQSAKREYRPFTEKEVTADLAAPQTDVYAPNVGSSEVVAVVVAPRGSADPAKVIRPIRTVPAGAGVPRGLIATFPMDVISDRHEFRVVFRGDLQVFKKAFCKRDGPTKDTAECVVPIDMGKIR